VEGVLNVLCTCMYHSHKLRVKSLTPTRALHVLFLQMNSPGDNTAEERDIKPEILWQGVETTHGSEVNQAVGGLLTVLNRHASCGD